MTRLIVVFGNFANAPKESNHVGLPGGKKEFKNGRQWTCRHVGCWKCADVPENLTACTIRAAASFTRTRITVAAGSSGIPVHSYQTTRRHIQKTAASRVTAVRL
jgi:hypothetical protein